MKKQSLSYRSRLTLICLLLVTVPLAVVSITVISRSYSEMQGSVQTQANQSMHYLNRELDGNFSDIRDVLNRPFFDDNVLQIMLRHVSGDKTMMSFAESHQLSGFLTGTDFDSPALADVKLYLLNGTYASSNGMTYQWSRENEPWMDYCDTDVYRSFLVVDNGNVIACRAITQPLFGEKLGYLRISLRPAFLTELIEDIGLPEGTGVYIINEFEQFIYPIGANVYETIEMDSLEDEYVYSIATSDKSNLEIVVRMSSEKIDHAMHSMIFQLVGLSVTMLVLSWFIAYYASNYMTRPITKLKEKMELVGMGHFDTRMKVDSSDEIGQLEAMVNNMTANVETLIHEVYEVSLASRDAQISALQSQINPHFLYNTLETINMQAISAKEYDISDAVSALGSMMRYCVSNERHFATLEEEFNFVSAYFDIQKLREDRLRSLVICCSEEDRHLQVPKLVLQPFVENVIQHGIGEGEVDVRIEVNSGEADLLISIENNGCPLTAEAMCRIHRAIKEAECDCASGECRGKGYGLANVHRRLRLLYGDRCGIGLDETYSQGARFLLHLKRKET